jgi:hypothetical protein
MNTIIPTTEGPRQRTGYTIDEDDRSNNYAIEPEMYINEPGDLRQAAEKAKLERLRELAEMQESEEGKLTIEHDFRHKGPGLL